MGVGKARQKRNLCTSPKQLFSQPDSLWREAGQGTEAEPQRQCGKGRAASVRLYLCGEIVDVCPRFPNTRSH